MKIETIKARQILDSRGNPTVQVDVSDGTHTATASVPSGASTGTHEACELRDGGTAFGGKGVQKAVDNVNNVIAPALEGENPQKQSRIDEIMLKLDGTEQKTSLGANAILGVSLAVARLAAKQKNMPLWKHIHQLFGGNEAPTLPRPMMNVINGGEHADNGVSIQEFMLFPKFGDFKKNLQAGAEIFQVLKGILHEKGLSTAVGDEGGFAPMVKNTKEALELLISAIKKANYEPKTEIGFALDAAASEFYNKNTQKYEIDGKSVTNHELTTIYAELCQEFPIESIEDSHDEDDFDGFIGITKDLGQKTQLVGDDLFVTNPKRLKLGFEKNMGNAILIKVNQIGSLTETFETIRMAKAQNFGVIISHRSGETADTFISDLAVGTSAGQIKTGSLSRSDRTAKYNRLLQICEELV